MMVAPVPAQIIGAGGGVPSPAGVPDRERECRAWREAPDREGERRVRRMGCRCRW